MKGDEQPRPDKALLEKLPKAKLIAMILEQREEMRIRLEAHTFCIGDFSMSVVLYGSVVSRRRLQSLEPPCMCVTQANRSFLEVE